MMKDCRSLKKREEKKISKGKGKKVMMITYSDSNSSESEEDNVFNLSFLANEKKSKEIMSL